MVTTGAVMIKCTCYFITMQVHCNQCLSIDKTNIHSSFRSSCSVALGKQDNLETLKTVLVGRYRTVHWLGNSQYRFGDRTRSRFVQENPANGDTQNECTRVHSAKFLGLIKYGNENWLKACASLVGLWSVHSRVCGQPQASLCQVQA